MILYCCGDQRTLWIKKKMEKNDFIGYFSSLIDCFTDKMSIIVILDVFPDIIIML